MSSSSEASCIFEKVLAANADEIGAVAEELEEEISVLPVDDNGITKTIRCDRCGKDFHVYNDGVMFLPRPPVDCPDDVKTAYKSTSFIRIDLSKFVKPIIW